MRLFKQGQKVTPVSKTVEGFGSLESCYIWESAKDSGQNFLYVVGYDEENKCYVLDNDKNSLCGNFYNESDLVEYIEDERIKFDVLEQSRVILSNGICAQVNQIEKEAFLRNCKKQDGTPLWMDGLEECDIETLNYDDIKELHKLFGDMIKFVEQNKKPKKKMTLQQIEEKLGHEIELI